MFQLHPNQMRGHPDLMSGGLDAGYSWPEPGTGEGRWPAALRLAIMVIPCLAFWALVAVVIYAWVTP